MLHFNYLQVDSFLIWIVTSLHETRSNVHQLSPVGQGQGHLRALVKFSVKFSFL